MCSILCEESSSAVLTYVDADADFDVLRDALFRYQVLVLKNQSHISSYAQYALTQRFDPLATASYGHGKTLDAKKSILHPDLQTVPHQPQVQIIGNGQIASYEGLENAIEIARAKARYMHFCIYKTNGRLHVIFKGQSS